MLDARSTAADPAATPSPEAAPGLSAAESVVSVRGLEKIYDSSGRRVRALAGVDLDVPRGAFFAIMGASGSGKSTLLHLVGGLTRPTNGQVLVEGRDLAGLSDRARTVIRRRRMGIIFQDYNLLPTLTARENVALPMLLEGTSLAACEQRVNELLAAVHLSERAHHRPDALSGGEQQRVAIARALLNDPAIVLADEPTGNLDSKQSVEIWALLRRFASEQGKTILMVTHEAAGAAFADRVIVLKDGRVVGTLAPQGSLDAALVATGYQQLAG
ncbi:MAG: ABC transporter ATP-binding protein [Phycisphaerales bacterium]|nr:ABC transporter ATP-binding protein [Phycisphaerales bacterium]